MPTHLQSPHLPQVLQVQQAARVGQRLFLLRHGETDYNRLNIVQGAGIDAHLNPLGQQQAQLFFEAYKSVPFRQGYVSGLVRTQQTLQPFAQQLTLTPLLGLNEYHWGHYEGQPFDDELKQTLQPLVQAWRQGDVEVPVPGGESPLQVWQRASQALVHILHQNPEGDMLVCTHGRMLRIMLSCLLGEGLHQMELYQHHNTGLNVLEVTEKGITATLLNDITHLAALPDAN